MKADIHPTYNKETKVSCACGNAFNTGSTKDEIRVDICSNCHPFYTGSAKFIDTEGRVEKFQRQEKEAVITTEQIRKKRDEKRAKDEKPRPTSLKEMMELIQKQK